MAVPSVTLTGSAINGIVVDTKHLAALKAAALPREVKLGRLPVDPATAARIPKMKDFWDRKLILPPPTTNWREKAAPVIARMYLNDQYGDCVIASNLHLLGVLSANDPDSGGIIQATDNEIYSMYQTICGRGDNGCNIEQTLQYGMNTGWTAGGKKYKIDGYASVDWTNKTLVQAVQAIGGASKIGINLPQAWTNSNVWDVTNSQIVGGHDVLPIDCTEQGVYVASWGRLYLITWPAFLATRWLEEYYFVKSQVWTNADKMAPNGFDDAKLTKALATFKAGGIPDYDPSPTPVPPDPSPLPPSPTPPGKFPARVLLGGCRVDGDQVSFQAIFAAGAKTAVLSGSASRIK